MIIQLLRYENCDVLYLNGLLMGLMWQLIKHRAIKRPPKRPFLVNRIYPIISLALLFLRVVAFYATGVQLTWASNFVRGAHHFIPV